MRTDGAHTFVSIIPTMVLSKKEDKTMSDSRNQKYYLVTAMCGHVGKLRYVPKNFAVCAASRSEASQLVKGFRRVKKHRKDAILSCVEISYEQFLVQRDINNSDPYLKAKCRADVAKDEYFIYGVKRIEKKNRKEERPLSAKYRIWKTWGRYLARAHCLGERHEDQNQLVLC